jgi:hypothetical protein
VTRKHFTAIALMLKTQLGLAESPHEAELVARIIRNLAAQFSQINGSFDFSKFYSACGLTPQGYLPEISAEDVSAAIAAIKNMGAR